jgi:16S rRNA (cytidine1402-2'-O)-methyltransferase
MPAISDPGEDIVRMCAENGVEVYTVPGPSALISALALSGLPTGRFTFEGFLSTASKSRREHLESLRGEERTMIFYEAPHKLLKTLSDLVGVFGPDRPVSVCRELTKIHEDVLRTTLSGALRHFNEIPPKGEFVLVVAGKPVDSSPSSTAEEAMVLVDAYRSEGLSLREACKRAAADTGFSKNELYSMALEK